ncbi:MAG: hypothetical protein DRN03_00315 [Thermoplasmata archaeon]|nr:MAG: hypothetical protein DRN03_00315 [Thermoplasmata archaeon]
MKFLIYVKTKDGKEYYAEDFLLTEKDIVLYDAVDRKGNPVGTITIKEGEWQSFYAKTKPFLKGEK